MRVLVAASELVGTAMAGPGIRASRFARELARRHEVTLSVPRPADIEIPGVEIRVANPYDAAGMSQLCKQFDAVVAQRLPVPTVRALARTSVRTVYDLYAPLTIENLAYDRGRVITRRDQAFFRLNVLGQEALLRYGDSFVCASERQRDLWLGALLATGRIDHETFGDDASLHKLIEVVPFGIEPNPPRPGRVLRGFVHGFDDDSEILLWPGGIWNWFDPLTVIRATSELAKSRENLRLYFLGIRHPNPGVPAMEMAARAYSLTNELGLLDRNVFFNRSWVSYEQRGSYLLEADIGVSAHYDDLEAHFAFRTRLVDCFWAGLPVITTSGDSLAELVAQRDLGRVVQPLDVKAWVDSISFILDDQSARDRIRTALESVRRELEWPRVVEPLLRLLEVPTKPRRRRDATIPRYVGARIDLALASRGIAGATTRVLEILRGRLTQT
jgi:glycosyltransferase involved in cell wall biosynthesis